MKFTVTYEELNKLILCYTKEMNIVIKLEYHTVNTCMVKANFKGLKLNWVISNPAVINNAISFNNNVEGLFSLDSMHEENRSNIVELKNGLITINLNPFLHSKKIPIQIDSFIFTDTEIEVKANVKS